MGDFRPVESFSGELREDENVIAAFEKASEEILIDYHPVAGKKYELRVHVPGYGKVKASTHVPLPPRADAIYTGERWAGRYDLYHHFNITSISPQEPGRAVWITAYSQYDDGSILGPSSELYCNNGFIDQINGVRDDMDAMARGSNIGYEKFIRVPFKNIGRTGDISFSFDASEKQSLMPPYPLPDDWDCSQLEELPLKYLYVSVIAPSDDYDRYFRSLYKQELYNYDPDMPLFDETVNVYSNVENGLGIFAGYSTSTYTHKYEQKEGRE